MLSFFSLEKEENFRGIFYNRIAKAIYLESALHCSAVVTCTYIYPYTFRAGGHFELAQSFYKNYCTS